MKRPHLPLPKRAIASLVIILSIAFSSTAHAREIIMCTVPWAPFYGPELENNGFFTELATAAFEEAGHEAHVEFMPWARAMLEVRQGDRHVLMGAYYTEERAEIYAPSDEVYAVEVGLVALRDLGIERFDGLHDVRGYTIGYGRGWVTSEEFDNADYLDKEAADSNVLNVRKLYAGRIDMIAMNFDRFRQIAIEEGFDPDEAVFLDPPLKSSGMYLMFSRTLDDPEGIAGRFNEGLRAIRENGRYDHILSEHGFGDA